MKDQQISFETAKLAKEKGFHWRHLVASTPAHPNGLPRIQFTDGPVHVGHENPCFSEEGKEISPKMYNPNNPHYPRPTQSLLAKWLRQEHKLYAMANMSGGDSSSGKLKILWKGRVIFMYDTEDGRLYITPSKVRDTHEEALEDALQEALKLIEYGKE